MTITRQEVRANREKWIAFLKEPERKKGVLQLSEGGEYRCCLGHGCAALGIQFKDGDTASYKLLRAVGLHYRDGSGYLLKTPNFGRWPYCNLQSINDCTSATPQEIGAYLETVIEGGESTPFRPLSEYPEASDA